MLLRRKILLVASIVLVIGPIGATVGYGIYLRSDYYRAQVETWLTNFFELPTDIGRVAPLSLSSRRFGDVTVWLPGRRERVFHCRQALWSYQDELGPGAFELDVREGALTLGSESWQLEDYRRILQSSLAHDFSKMNLREVRLADIDLTLDRRDVQLLLPAAAGTVRFLRPDEARGALYAYAMNGRRVEQPIQVLVRFNPLDGLTFHEVTLDVPPLDVAALGLDGVLHNEITSGQFRGQISYREKQQAWEVDLSGEAREIRLAEFTQRVPQGPIDGLMDLSIEHLHLKAGFPTLLRFRGHLREVELMPLATLLGAPAIDGTADLIVESGHIEKSRIIQLSVRGMVDGPSLETITQRLGQGIITGYLSVSVNSLHVVNNEIRAADIDLIAMPAEGNVGVIDRQVILGVLKTLFGVDLGRIASILPEQVPYVQFGVKLLVDDGTLRFLGTHGSNDDTILTVRVLGRDWPIVKQPSTTIELKPLLDELERQAADFDLDDLRRWWEGRKTQ